MNNELTPSDDHGHGHSPVPSDHPFADPGLPHHAPRRTDVDPRAANRAERQVAALFTLSTLLTFAFIVCFVTIDKDESIRIVTLGTVNALNFALGVTLGLSLLCIGVGAIHWARKLMNAEEAVQERHPMKSSPQDTAEVLELAKAGAADSALPRRKMIWTSLAGALAVFPLAPLLTLRDLGPLPHRSLRVTLFADPERRQIVTANGERRIRPEDLQVGSLVSCKPNGTVSLTELAKSAVMMVRLRPEDIKSQVSLDKSYQGILCYSKICSHAGCPLGLYEQTTHHMLCPCHQTTFDLANSGKVVFGPGARNLEQLAITVDAEGFLVAVRDFDGPVGASYWERG
ncbi:MAG: cytochrome bc1 complex Rieske iron-sulfur subunit [Sporichthyaceae bacterium]